jgi:hypothetical protein
MHTLGPQSSNINNNNDNNYYNIPIVTQQTPINSSQQNFQYKSPYERIYNANSSAIQKSTLSE